MNRALMKRLGLLLTLCLVFSACSAPAAREAPEASVLTVEEAREALAQALMERNASYLSYDPEAGLETEGIHFVWSDVFWSGEILEAAVENTEIYCFDLVYGSDADDGLEDVANPMAGRLAGSYGVGKDGGSLWQYRQDLGEWEPLP